jgi:CheY-like chemotaxis protein
VIERLLLTLNQLICYQKAPRAQKLVDNQYVIALYFAVRPRDNLSIGPGEALACPPLAMIGRDRNNRLNIGIIGGGSRSSRMSPAEYQQTVLVVEDEAPMRASLETVLKQHHFRVLLASDGEEAIGLYRSNKQQIDVVLLDVGLPEIGGLDVFLDMRAQNPNVRVVVASGYLAPSVKSKLSAAGIEHFIAKPYSLGQVVDALRESC